MEGVPHTPTHRGYSPNVCVSCKPITGPYQCGYKKLYAHVSETHNQPGANPLSFPKQHFQTGSRLNDHFTTLFCFILNVSGCFCGSHRYPCINPHVLLTGLSDTLNRLGLGYPPLIATLSPMECHIPPLEAMCLEFNGVTTATVGSVGLVGEPSTQTHSERDK